jgi:hypothetical protein
MKRRDFVSGLVEVNSCPKTDKIDRKKLCNCD